MVSWELERRAREFRTETAWPRCCRCVQRLIVVCALVELITLSALGGDVDTVSGSATAVLAVLRTLKGLRTLRLLRLMFLVAGMRKVVLTASGGAFRDVEAAELARRCKEDPEWVRAKASAPEEVKRSTAYEADARSLALLTPRHVSIR